MQEMNPQMSVQDVNKISMLGLAHVGDAVYELLFRTLLCQEGHSSVAQLHRLTVEHVKAEAQAAAVEVLLPVLTEDEKEVFTPLSASIMPRPDWRRFLAGSIFREKQSGSVNSLPR